LRSLRGVVVLSLGKLCEEKERETATGGSHEVSPLSCKWDGLDCGLVTYDNAIGSRLEVRRCLPVPGLEQRRQVAYATFPLQQLAKIGSAGEKAKKKLCTAREAAGDDTAPWKARVRSR